MNTLSSRQLARKQAKHLRLAQGLFSRRLGAKTVERSSEHGLRYADWQNFFLDPPGPLLVLRNCGF